MSSNDEVKISEEEGKLTLESDLFRGERDEDESDWQAVPIDSERFLLQSKKSRNGMAKQANGMASCSIDVFANFMCGLSHRRWSGVVTVDIGSGIKKFYVGNGEILFARSNVMDDRLGEVIYRYDSISLDQLTESAVQVTREVKFGQVLLRNGILTSVDLWNALKAQVRDIVRSVFLVPRLYFEIDSDSPPPPTEVVFTEGTRTLIDESYSFGCMYQEFVSRLSPEAKVEIVKAELAHKKFKPGSFVSDLLELIEANPKLTTVVESSKLTETNTYVALMSLVNRGFCTISSPVRAEHAQAPDGIGPLKAKIDAYTLLVGIAKQKFKEANERFPASELRHFTFQLNTPGFVSLYLNDQAEINRESLLNIYSQCRDNRDRIDYFVVRLESVIQFLQQIAGDLLPYQIAKTIRNEYRNIVQ